MATGARRCGSGRDFRFGRLLDLLLDCRVHRQVTGAVHKHWPSADDALFFASNAIYPLTLMPLWLRRVSRVNPLTSQVDALRSLMIVGGSTSFGLALDFAFLAAALAVLVTLATRLYPKIIT